MNRIGTVYLTRQSPRGPRALLCWTFALLAALASSGSAQKMQQQGQVLLDQAVPPEDGHDYVQLTNGEWMQGELLEVRDDSVYFDSDEFGEHAVDFEDVARMFIRSPVTIGLEDQTSVSGVGVLAKDELVLQTPTGPRTIDRGQILVIAPAATSELQRWSLDASIGLNAIKGNSDQVAWNAAASIERLDSFSRLWLDYSGNYTESNSEAVTHNHRASGRFELRLWRSLFVVPATAIGEYNEFTNLGLRFTAMAGAGIHLIDTAKVEWDVFSGGGYSMAKYISVLPDEEERRDNLAIAGGTELTIEVTGDIDFRFEYLLTLIATEIGLTTHHLVSALELDLTSIFDLDFRFVFDRTEEPVATVDGDVPEQDDYQFIVGLGIEL